MYCQGLQGFACVPATLNVIKYERSSQRATLHQQCTPMQFLTATTEASEK